MIWNIYFAYFYIRPRYGIIIFLLGGGGRKHKSRLITHVKIYELCREKCKENRILRGTSMYVLFINKLFSHSLLI